MDEEILVTLESVSECNIFEREKIVEANQHFQNENLEDFTQLFDLKPPTNQTFQNFYLLMKQR